MTGLVWSHMGEVRALICNFEGDENNTNTGSRYPGQRNFTIAGQFVSHPSDTSRTSSCMASLQTHGNARSSDDTVTFDPYLQQTLRLSVM
jgi:hypothetical protein